MYKCVMLQRMVKLNQTMNLYHALRTLNNYDDELGSSVADSGESEYGDAAKSIETKLDKKEWNPYCHRKCS